MGVGTGVGGLGRRFSVAGAWNRSAEGLDQAPRALTRMALTCTHTGWLGFSLWVQVPAAVRVGTGFARPSRRWVVATRIWYFAPRTAGQAILRRPAFQS